MSEINELEQGECLPAFLPALDRMNQAQAEACGRRGGAIGSRFGGIPGAICETGAVGEGARGALVGTGPNDPYFGTIEYHMNAPTYDLGTRKIHISWTLPPTLPESTLRNSVVLAGSPSVHVGYTLFYSPTNDIFTAQRIFAPNKAIPGTIKIPVPVGSYVWGITSTALDHQTNTWSQSDLVAIKAAGTLIDAHDWIAEMSGPPVAIGSGFVVAFSVQD